MTEASTWTAGRVAALAAASLVAGALVAVWRAPAPRAARAEREEPAFAAPALRQRAAPALSSRLLDGFTRTPRPLPDDLFADPPATGQPSFEEIAAPLSGALTQFRALGRPEGSFVRDRARGWLSFRGQRWVGVKREEVPDNIRRCWPDADPQAMRREPPSRDGDVEVR